MKLVASKNLIDFVYYHLMRIVALFNEFIGKRGQNPLFRSRLSILGQPLVIPTSKQECSLKRAVQHFPGTEMEQKDMSALGVI